MSKETSYAGMSFRIRFVSPSGRLLIHTEWTENRDAVIYVTDKINNASKRSGIGISAFTETKGTAQVKAERYGNL